MVILVLSVVALSLFVVFYFFDVVRLFSRVGGLEIVYAGVVYENDSPVIVLTLANRGVYEESVTGVEVNGVGLNVSFLPFMVYPGNTLTVKIVGVGYLRHGNTYSVAVVTGSGRRFVKLFRVP